MLQANLLVSDHDIAGLFGVRTAADTQVKIGRGYLEVLQDRIRHVVVVMLACMHEHGIGPVGFLELVVKRRDLHEIGACGGDEMYVDQ